ncbi:aminotransferase class I/II-fold pyridoxal phosphate-dependent enzyme [Bradyrhizobium sp. 168]|uniref:aminotransferase class I/II-fold pyridoxal phosphate-dependent enzyme n=1 Tax=Bradyrhizobium sp. 168 TaxID=2782639 RepID=UPI001FF8C14D|nr:aminotransferase class I/II-fold pyridoxal phosphate-dependent enzyme [Bradyrhizobium sp. 168]MCK1578028.1 aminotransferase class I/II-fold pyridoxal phosphate-dependent enzyme [Bradyrhizobium sp. 168]
MLAQRTALLNSSHTAAAWTAITAAAASADQIIDLSAEEIQCELAPMVREGAMIAINRNMDQNTLTSDPTGLRKAIARKLSAETDQHWSADEVAVTGGSSPALFNVAMVLLDPGDEVLIPAPHWTAFPAQVLLIGGTPIFIETRHNNYVPELTDLASAVTSKTKAIVVNTPNNPTGSIYNRDTLAGIAQLAIERDLWIVFDECYGAFAHAPYHHLPIVSVSPRARARTLIVNSFSKSLALAGWRIGYLAGPEPAIRAIRALQSHTTYNPDAIAQHALLHHLESADGGFQLKLQRHAADARTLGLSILSTLRSIPQPAAEGGFHFYLDLSGWYRRVKGPGPEFDADEVANVLLMEAGIATASGTVFGDPTGIRLSYGVDLILLEKALRRLTVTLNTWK